MLACVPPVKVVLKLTHVQSVSYNREIMSEILHVMSSDSESDSDFETDLAEVKRRSILESTLNIGAL